MMGVDFTIHTSNRQKKMAVTNLKSDKDKNKSTLHNSHDIAQWFPTWGSGAIHGVARLI